VEKEDAGKSSVLITKEEEAVLAQYFERYGVPPELDRDKVLDVLSMSCS
jgi:hypothetical protein